MGPSSAAAGITVGAVAAAGRRRLPGAAGTAHPSTGVPFFLTRPNAPAVRVDAERRDVRGGLLARVVAVRRRLCRRTTCSPNRPDLFSIHHHLWPGNC